MTSLGIPKDSVIRYEAAVKADKFVVAIHDASPEVAKKAQDILTAAGSSDVESHPAA